MFASYRVEWPTRSGDVLMRSTTQGVTFRIRLYTRLRIALWLEARYKVFDILFTTPRTELTDIQSDERCGRL